MVIDTGGVLTVSKSQTDVMGQQLSVSTTIGMEGIPLAFREAVVARMPSMIERQATVAFEESSVIIFVVDGQLIINSWEPYKDPEGSNPVVEVAVTVFQRLCNDLEPSEFKILLQHQREEINESISRADLLYLSHLLTMQFLLCKLVMCRRQ